MTDRWETKGTFMSSSFCLCSSVLRRLILHAILLIRRRLLAKLISRGSHCMMNSKDLLATQDERHANPICFFRTTEMGLGLSIDSARVVVQVAKDNRRRLAQSKGLTRGASIEQSGDLLAFCRATEKR